MVLQASSCRTGCIRDLKHVSLCSIDVERSPDHGYSPPGQPISPTLSNRKLPSSILLHNLKETQAHKHTYIHTHIY
ncbi:unnamed protein product [Protopolystoma xenopodis]|uniref:Uncharacterized protein n=1 Tax=Protopolystoma xenopodis TaxID=117903 RepID=A0A448WIA9_9PLAT|nr:unnamed protein product [Protopolystoma xenopodis]